jgi:hypothetical protein
MARHILGFGEPSLALTTKSIADSKVFTRTKPRSPDRGHSYDTQTPKFQTKSC